MRKALIVLFSLTALLTLPAGAEGPATCDPSEDPRGIQKYYNVANSQGHRQCLLQDFPHYNATNEASGTLLFISERSVLEFLNWITLAMSACHVLIALTTYNPSDTPRDLLLHFSAHSSAAALLLADFSSVRYGWIDQSSKIALGVLTLSWSGYVSSSLSTHKELIPAKFDLLMASGALVVLIKNMALH